MSIPATNRRVQIEKRSGDGAVLIQEAWVPADVIERGSKDLVFQNRWGYESSGWRVAGRLRNLEATVAVKE